MNHRELYKYITWNDETRIHNAGRRWLSSYEQSWNQFINRVHYRTACSNLVQLMVLEVHYGTLGKTDAKFCYH